jgi:SAM-dependent methyltransferase
VNRPLLGDESLVRSEVVANSEMNRGRGLDGVNSYTRDLGSNPYDFLTERLKTREKVSWLDLCCGSGRALIEAARLSKLQGHAERMSLTGVDLIPMFDPIPDEWSHLQLIAAPLHEWEPNPPYDLITCVHGLHYIGDKLGLLQRVAGWLKEDGHFASHLDPANLRLSEEDDSGRSLIHALRRAGFRFNRRKSLLTLTGASHSQLLYVYAGADDQAGPNLTGQPAVHSYYSLAPKPDPSLG